MKPRQIASVGPSTSSHDIGLLGAGAMRSILATGLFIALSASTSAAAKEHYSKSRHVVTRPGPAATPRIYSSASYAAAGGARIAVPGWTEEQTRQWMDSYHGGTD